jgi:hypothetical protein
VSKNSSTPPKVQQPFALLEVPKPGFYPADVSYFGGAVIVSSVFTNVYFAGVPGCSTESCWGHPFEFLTDLTASKFLRITNHYVGSTAPNRYAVNDQFVTVASGFCTSPSFCSGNDILSLAAALGSQFGNDSIYHIFLPQGTDTCMDEQKTQCYSPDMPQSFVFCGYHASVGKGANEVLFTVEPYQAVPGCEVAQPSPNGLLDDSTNSVLSHETFEIITDPNGDGWFAISSLPELGNEIGDLCQGPINRNNQEIAPQFTIHGHLYEVQAEYSNKYHACSVKK